MSNQQPEEFQRDYDDQFDFDPKEKIKRSWEKSYFMTRFSVITSVTIFLIVFFVSESAQKSLKTTFEDTILNGQIYTLILSPFVVCYIYEVVLLIFVFGSESNIMEKQKGSLILYLDILIKNIIMQLTFVLVMAIIGSIFPSLKQQQDNTEALKSQKQQQTQDNEDELQQNNDQYQSVATYSSLLPYAFMLLTNRCLQNPEKVIMFLCLPMQMKRKYYPFVLFGFICVFQFRFDLLVGILFGYLLKYVPQQIYFQKLQACVVKIENQSFFQRIQEEFKILSLEQAEEQDQNEQGGSGLNNYAHQRANSQGDDEQQQNQSQAQQPEDL